MGRLILNPTPESQWHALIQEAHQDSSITLNEDMESYLVFLLMRFAKNPDLARSIFAIDFLENTQKSTKESEPLLRDIGDKCLLFSGLFPNVAKRHRVRVSYYVKLGQSAYSHVSSYHRNHLSVLFSELCNQFVGLMDVLQSIRALDKNYTVLNFLDAYELWADTQSVHALKILKKSTFGHKVSPLTGYLINPDQRH